MPSTRDIIRFLLSAGENAPNLDMKMATLKNMCDAAGVQYDEIVRFLVSEVLRLRDCLEKAGKSQRSPQRRKPRKGE